MNELWGAIKIHVGYPRELWSIRTSPEKAMLRGLQQLISDASSPVAQVFLLHPAALHAGVAIQLVPQPVKAVKAHHQR